jgi:hypothetical protein
MSAGQAKKRDLTARSRWSLKTRSAPRKEARRESFFESRERAAFKKVRRPWRDKDYIAVRREVFWLLRFSWQEPKKCLSW